MIIRDQYPISTAVLLGLVFLIVVWFIIGMAVFLPAGQWLLWVFVETLISTLGFITLLFTARAEERGGW